MPLQRKRLTRWYCMNTHYKQEFMVETQIKALGYSTELFPFSSDGKAKSLFPGYLFVRFNIQQDSWRRLWSLPGVRCIFSQGPQNPTAIPGRLLDICRFELRKITGDPDPNLPAISEGDEIQLTAGAFRQFSGICSKRSDERVSILLTIFGRPQTLEVNAADCLLIKAAAA
jgi:transcription antitermination factor NusG